MTPKVYVTQEVMVVDNASGKMRRKFNMTDAAKYGELVVLLPASRSMMASVPVVRELLEKLREFKQGDYLLPLGDPAIMAAAAGIAAKYSNGMFNVLKWDRLSNTYIAVPLDLSGKTL